MPGLIDSRKTEISILPHFTKFFSINNEGCIVSSSKFCAVFVIEGQGDGLPAEPVAGVVSIAVVEGNADVVVEDHFEVGNEVGIDVITTLLEGVEDVLADGGIGAIVEVDTESILDVREIKVLCEIGWWGGVHVRVADAGNHC